MKRRLALVLLFFPVALFAQIPHQIPYQGVYTDTLGNPKPDGIYTFTFRLYDMSSGGSVLWTEIKDLQVKRGLFQTRLGDTTPFGVALTFETPYYLSVKPGADPELAPRVAFLPVPSSLFAAKSDTARNALSIPDNSVSTAKLANSAVSAAKTLDEPGIEYVETNLIGTVSTASATSLVASITVTAPAAGFVEVTASGLVALNRTSDAEDMVRVKVSNTANDVGETAGVQFIRLQPGAGSGNFAFPFCANKVYAVSAGSTTFYLNMWHQVQAGTALWDTYTLIAKYFATRY